MPEAGRGRRRDFDRGAAHRSDHRPVAGDERAAPGRGSAVHCSPLSRRTKPRPSTKGAVTRGHAVERVDVRRVRLARSVQRGEQQRADREQQQCRHGSGET
jgi:hypothetical protein